MAAEAKAAVLISHQGDQRGDDDGQVVGGDARELVAEALAAAGRHHHEAVAAGQRCGHGLTLAGPEPVEAEVGEQGIRITRPHVAALECGFDIDPVEPDQRASRGCVVVEQRCLSGGGACAAARAEAIGAASARSASDSERQSLRSPCSSASTSRSDRSAWICGSRSIARLVKSPIVGSE